MMGLDVAGRFATTWLARMGLQGERMRELANIQVQLKRRLKKLGPIAAVLALGAGVAGCAVKGNDTGGIMAFQGEPQDVVMARADGHCAMHGKYAVISSVHPWQGGYIGFNCLREGRTIPFRN
jgi:hypothetical protein